MKASGGLAGYAKAYLIKEGTALVKVPATLNAKQIRFAFLRNGWLNDNII